MNKMKMHSTSQLIQMMMMIQAVWHPFFKAKSGQQHQQRLLHFVLQNVSFFILFSVCFCRRSYDVHKQSHIAWKIMEKCAASARKDECAIFLQNPGTSIVIAQEGHNTFCRTVFPSAAPSQKDKNCNNLSFLPSVCI